MPFLFRRSCARLFAASSLVLLALHSATFAETARETIAKALVLESSEEQAKAITSLAGNPDEQILPLLDAWRDRHIYLYEETKGEEPNTTTVKHAVQFQGEADADDKKLTLDVATGQPLKDAMGQPLRLAEGELLPADPDQTVKVAMNVVELNSPKAEVRRSAAVDIGREQNIDLLPPLQSRQKVEKEDEVLAALREAINLTQLEGGDDAAKLAAVKDLGKAGTISSKDALVTSLRKAPAGSQLATEIQKAIDGIEAHIKTVNFFGALFRGLSMSSVLLIAALGLAITFGLMGVINMAHGELMAVGAYATYLMQGIFGNGRELSPFGLKVSIPGMHLTGSAYDLNFLAALPFAFLCAALVGIVLERGIIQFLYRRPLESLLATWGISVVLQQLLQLTFGSDNKQVDAPAYLAGTWTWFGIDFGWNRLFIIGSAIVIIAGTWALLNLTPLGLLIRAVMQNRLMAACMGVRTQRVNMMTFAFGSGLAGLAGAFLSQIGNVGPRMGQDYIVSAFMTVVLGGVGSLAGTVVSALGIGMSEQSLQQILLNPVLGKILVLVGIILFLQWRPSGIFVTKSRSLES